MSVKEYLERTYEPNNEYNVRKGIVCSDGFYLSVQGGTKYHYCSPRSLCNFYDEVEVGFPSAEEITLNPYKDGDGDPTKTVYGYVPIEIVEEIVMKHGGIKEAKDE